MLFLIQALVIFLFSLYTFYPSFSLGLFGDDWLMLWRYMHYFGPGAPVGVTNHFTYFLGGYGPYEITMGLLYNFFGFNSSIYYLFSYFFRLLAAFAVWPVIFYLTRSKLAAFYSSLFLSITVIGLETTNWVFNMTSYLAITFFSLFLYFFIKSREYLKINLFVLSAICFYLAHIFAPIRMTGLLPFTFILEIFLYVRSKNIKLSLLRLFVIFSIFMVISTTGAVTETQGKLIGGAAGIVNSGFHISISLLRQGQYSFLFNPVITVGRMIIPDIYFATTPNQKPLLLTIGSIIIISSIFLFKLTRKTKLSIAFFVSIFWIICSFLITWVREPEALFPTEYRYFIPTAVGFAILFGAIIGLGKTSKAQINLFMLMSIILILHIITTRNYLIKEVVNSHGKDAINKMLATLPNISQLDKSKGPIVYYFKSAAEKQNLLYYGVQFGLPYRMAFLNKEFDSNAYFRMPLTMGEWTEAVSAVTDGKSLVSRGHPQKPIPINNIYAFFLTSDNNLLNITEEARIKLRE